MLIPTDSKNCQAFLGNLVSDCRISQSRRAEEARSYRQWKYQGTNTDTTAIFNALGPHQDRLTSYLFSPYTLRFHLTYDMHYAQRYLDMAEVAGKYLTKNLAKRNIDLKFQQGVEIALDYGSCIYKLGWGNAGLTYRHIFPWNFGVYFEGETDLDAQEAMCETSYITVQDFWRRISHLDGAIDILKRAKTHAKKVTPTSDVETPYFEVLLSGSQPAILTDGTVSSQAGGSLATAAPLGAMMSSEIAQNMICVHELTIMDDVRGDWTTIQYAEPDIVISKMKRTNLFLDGSHPYGLIQANPVPGLIWGRSEMANLVNLQSLMSNRLEDIKSIMSVQYDRIRSFTGFSGFNDETFDEMKSSGWISSDVPGAKVDDITPPLPPEAFEDLKMIKEMIDESSGFQNILSGQGEAGVRSGNHAATLMKTASPRMRDRAIMVERQCSAMADKAFDLIAAKNGDTFWINPDDEASTFLLSQIPKDAIVEVDSHSSSPIYEEDHKELVGFLLKAQAIDGESVIDLLQPPLQDLLKDRYRKMQEEHAKLVKEHPEILTGKKPGPGGHHGK